MGAKTGQAVISEIYCLPALCVENTAFFWLLLCRVLYDHFPGANRNNNEMLDFSILLPEKD